MDPEIQHSMVWTSGADPFELIHHPFSSRLDRSGQAQETSIRMARVVIQHLHKTFPTSKKSDPVYAVKDLNLEIRDGEFLVLVGPSGCGKSTTLRLIAGLEEISEGTIRIGDTVVNRV